MSAGLHFDIDIIEQVKDLEKFVADSLEEVLSTIFSHQARAMEGGGRVGGGSIGKCKGFAKNQRL